jgi:hypothetical protein
MNKKELWVTPIYEFNLNISRENNKQIFVYLDKNIESRSFGSFPGFLLHEVETNK